MITFLQGDATQPQARPSVIVHVCNDLGGWGAGFVMALSRRWKEPERIYRTAFRSEHIPQLGDVQFIEVESGLFVANMIAQHGIGRGPDGLPPIRYDAVGACLAQVAAFAKQRGASVHMPRIGCGLAGGRWEKIEPILHATLVAAGVATTVHDFAAKARTP